MYVNNHLLININFMLSCNSFSIYQMVESISLETSYSYTPILQVNYTLDLELLLSE